MPVLTFPCILFLMYFTEFQHILRQAKSIPDNQKVRAWWHKLENPIITNSYFFFKKFGAWEEICHGKFELWKFELWKFELRGVFVRV